MPHAIVDAHLDMAWNVLNGRDLELAAADVRAQEQKTEQECMVTLPELRRGGVAIVFGSIFVRPQHTGEDRDPVFDEDTHRQGLAQADVYRRWEDQGLVRIIRDQRSLAAHLAAWQEDSIPGVVVAIEGAEPIKDPDELPRWFELGVRSIGTAWGFSRYSGGYSGSWGRPGGFTEMGRELLAGMLEMGILLDVAHGSAELRAEGIALAPGRVTCTHTSPREVIGIERMPDGAEMKALAAVGGVTGLGLGGIFLDRGWWREGGERPPLPLAKAAEVLSMMAEAAGWDHVGIGSDLDGGIGVQESPDELESIADIGRLADFLPPEAVEPVMGGNWIKLLERALPA